VHVGPGKGKSSLHTEFDLAVGKERKAGDGQQYQCFSHDIGFNAVAPKPITKNHPDY
jgi:hypothetical protein